MKNIRKELEEILDKDTEILKINCKLLLEAFDKLDEDTRLIEFSKNAIAFSIIKHIINMVKELGEEEFTRIIKKEEFVGDVFRVLGTFNEVGVTLGYAKRIDNESKKD